MISCRSLSCGCAVTCPDASEGTPRLHPPSSPGRPPDARGDRPGEDQSQQTDWSRLHPAVPKSSAQRVDLRPKTQETLGWPTIIQINGGRQGRRGGRWQQRWRLDEIREAASSADITIVTDGAPNSPAFLGSERHCRSRWGSESQHRTEWSLFRNDISSSIIAAHNNGDVGQGNVSAAAAAAFDGASNHVKTRGGGACQVRRG